jgi:hypothetical protein
MQSVNENMQAITNTTSYATMGEELYVFCTLQNMIFISKFVRQSGLASKRVVIQWR